MPIESYRYTTSINLASSQLLKQPSILKRLSYHIVKNLQKLVQTRYISTILSS